MSRLEQLLELKSKVSLEIETEKAKRRGDLVEEPSDRLLRLWARHHGLKIGRRGRVPDHIRAAYKVAAGGRP